MLSLLVSTHWSHLWQENKDYFDTNFFGSQDLSVPIFAIITGLFVFRKTSLVWRNISRLMFIIILSITFSFATFAIINDKSIISTYAANGNYVGGVFLGGRDAWYLYAIIPCYFVGPLIYKWINLKRGIVIAFTFVGLFCAFSYTQANEVGITNVFYLFGLVFLGYVLKCLFEKFKEQRIKEMKVMSIFLSIIGISIVFTLSIFHSSIRIVNVIPAIGIVWTALCFPITNNGASKIIAFIAVNAYFVYEFHWLWQHVWNKIASDFILEHPHLQLYVNWIVISLFSWVVSFFVTMIQKHVWDRFVTKPIQFKIDNSNNRFVKLF